jgi:hypothetical protein
MGRTIPYIMENKCNVLIAVMATSNGILIYFNGI